MLPKNRQKIAIVGLKGFPNDFPGTSGVETYVQKQIPGLIKNCTVICYVRTWAKSKSMFQHKNFVVVTIPSVDTQVLDTLTYSFLATIHASFSNAEIVWYHTFGAAFFAWIPKLLGKQIYITIHALDWKRKKWGITGKTFLFFTEKISLMISDKIFVVSNTLYSNYLPVYKSKLHLDILPTTPASTTPPNIISSKYHIKKNRYILYLGRLVPEKRVEWLIKAYGLLETHAHSLVIAGGSSHTDAYARYIASLAQKCSGILTGYVFGKEKEELLDNCSLFVLPSELEGYPTSVVEALEHNKPCLLPDFLKTEFTLQKNITYFKTEDFSDFSRKLKTCILVS